MVKIFWEKLGDRLGAIIPPGATRRAQQIQKVCYCDGRRLMVFTGRVEGTIADAPRGTGGLHWEPIFVPDGQTRTLGEMSRAERLAASASAQAFAGLHDEIFR
jgi:XTP/dITP diphosphohydrolase